MFDLDTCLCFTTNKAAKKIAEAFNERLLKFGVTRVQWTAMYYLLKYNRMSQRELSEKMDIKESSMVRLIDRLEKDNYVSRSRDAKDKRVVYIELTEKGKDKITELLPEGERMSRIARAGIEDKDLEVFERVLRKFIENAENN
ncbi:DNA-binding transcriptional regulator, MarR family [Caloramator quimbayensis]|uniref:DNA-binding transcriptional regulator, MarR family n=1 Tax=Caloramator quimbayensis TaxID=1147123 RepID=A0A1T4XXK8_9CLOT|nr:MarR family transcriptional regulator [Caloramator quimbayensis]SKA93938.1 DNA-binding transcriptional regulator, MarR family [Caloramator quimbayensis]